MVDDVRAGAEPPGRPPVRPSGGGALSPGDADPAPARDPAAGGGSASVLVLAPAKVNLALHVVARRPDGYHTLDTLAVFPPVGDRLELCPPGSIGPRLEISGRFAEGLAADDSNLVLRAAVALGRADARFRLVKALPVAAGLGGGSADAAAALRLLMRDPATATPTPDRLAEIAARLGADVPMCLAGRPCRARGIGEILSPVPPLPTGGILLVNPGVPVATPAVFRALAAPSGEALPALPPAWEDAAALAAWLAGCRNDLEPPAIRVAPAIGPLLAVLERLPGALLARLSGSGATAFALFGSAAAAEAGAATIARDHPGWWCAAAPLTGDD